MTAIQQKDNRAYIQGIFVIIIMAVIILAAWYRYPGDGNTAQFKKHTDSLNRIIQVQRDSASYYRGMAAGYITQITQLQQDKEKKYETIKNIKDASNKKVAAVADYSNDSLVSFFENRYK